MARGKTMEVGETCPMNGGNGPYSYSQNSHYQRQAADAAKTMIMDSILDKLDIQNLPSNTLKIADFGCSVGANTLQAVQNIIETTKHMHKTLQLQQTLEFQVFFNDLTGNDFNTLFTTLPTPGEYFAAGVPGSFHSRLFPNATLNIAHSSYSLHWLSRVPEEVMDRESPTWNKGRVHYTKNLKVFEAYSAQFKRDMEGFFNARAQEIVGGGLMLLLLPGCQDGFLPCETSVSMQYDLFGSCLMDMVNIGMVSEEKVDSFNLPMYLTSPMEFRELIEANGCFIIERMENFNPYEDEDLPDFQVLATQFRAATEGLTSDHFGIKRREIMDELYDRFADKMAENTHLFDMKNMKEFIIFACLMRKNVHFNAEKNQN
ncbi:S-adenosyl-L-methionine-dependent methyltransferases superfamily protein [Actinidia rufa]|uniref:S-adenosyl-L-methionine-dependent methyltransferases superfamily protein n=1 Tax=Actinidia rufa TaxID=165716 RepID=A0A7J0H714_9ERIC|nr:S-adenosyl-L-methionine-dependent methyltransferases superfamily protein [Actinidia rufa]